MLIFAVGLALLGVLAQDLPLPLISDPIFVANDLMRLIFFDEFFFYARYLSLVKVSEHHAIFLVSPRFTVLPERCDLAFPID